MHNNSTYQRNERSRAKPRKPAKPRATGKQWTRQDTKRAAAML